MASLVCRPVSVVRKADIVVVILLTVAAVLWGGYLFLDRSSNDATVVVKRGGDVVYEGSLHKNAVVDVRAEDGTLLNRAKIEDGQVKMVEATCPDHYCVHQGATDKASAPIVCLPNRVMIMVTNQTNGAPYDAVAK